MVGAIVTSVYNRDPAVLLRSLESVRAALPDWPIVVVDDGSSLKYDLAVQELHWHRVDTKKAHPETYTLNGGYNNPAFAFNMGILQARAIGAERLLWFGSDCIAPPHLGAVIRTIAPENVVWYAKIVNQDTKNPINRAVWSSTAKPWPMHWCCLTTIEHALGCGEFDLEYLKGMAFEDNDFFASLALRVGRIMIDDRVEVLHQAHAQVAYSDRDKAHPAGRGWSTNEAYTLKKWSGIPGRMDAQDPLEYAVELRSMETLVMRVSKKAA